MTDLKASELAGSSPATVAALRAAITNSDALANDPDTTTGLFYGYKAGSLNLYDGGNTIAVGPVSISAGTVELADDATNYVVIDSDGVSANTSGSSTSSFPIARVTTASGEITSIIDTRTFVGLSGNGFKFSDLVKSIVVELLGELIVKAGDTATGQAPQIQLYGGNSDTGTGGDVQLFAGSASGLDGVGGEIFLISGNAESGSGRSGALVLRTGDSDAGRVGDITLQSGTSSSGEGGDIQISAGRSLKITDLPTADPENLNEIWNNNGVLTVSGGPL